MTCNFFSLQFLGAVGVSPTIPVSGTLTPPRCHTLIGVGRVTAPDHTGEESPDFIGHGALGNGGRGDPMDSATETNRLAIGKGEIVR